MIRSIAYSRYFRIAMAMAAHRQTNARLCSTFRNAEFTQIVTTNSTASTSAAVAHHFSCNRSSPEDLANRTTSAATLTSTAALIRMAASRYSTAVRPCTWLDGVNGCAHKRVAAISSNTAESAKAPPANHAASRHRRERTCPVGKSWNKKASMAIGMIQVQLVSQANARPAGQDPRAAYSACIAYWFAKPIRPSPSPATRNSQPIRFSGRREAMT